MECLYIIIPAYNESENIKNVIDSWYPVVEKYNGHGSSRLVIINDGSKDNTLDIIKSEAELRPLLVPLNKPNGGHGSTVLYGYRYAIQNGADYIFQTDSDGQTDPGEFHAFWDMKNNYEAIIGSRPNRQDGAFRKFVESVLLMLLRSNFGVKLPDSNAPFRLMESRLVSKYIDKMPENYNLPNVMFTTYFAYFNHNIRFKDISFKPRQGGKNSINVKKIFKIGKQAMTDFQVLRQNIDK